MKKISLLALMTLALAALPATGQAATIVGVADQSPDMFGDANFKRLGVKHSRLIVAYDTLDRPSERQQLDAWVAAARSARVTPLITFNHSNVNPKKRPSASEYRRAVRAFRARYPHIKTYSAWNEANHQSQPTFHRARLAATYYNVLRASCKGCKIVALDLLDQAGMAGYIKTFKRFAKKPRIWGLHNYRDTNRFRTSGTAAMLAATKGQVWMTETGGIVAFESAFPYNLRRASRALNQMFKISRSDRRLKRLYIYAWGGEERGHRFDAGLVNPDGSLRPSYTRVRQNVSRGKVKKGRKIASLRKQVRRLKAKQARKRR